MTPQKLMIFTSEELKQVELPEEIYNVGSDAVSAIWQVAAHHFQEELEKIQTDFHKKESDFLIKHQSALDAIDYLKKSTAELKQQIDLKERENKSVQVDLDRRIGELNSQAVYNERLEEKIVAHEHEIKHLIEELSRGKETVDYQHRRIEEFNRQTKLDEKSIEKLKEELNTTLRQKERLLEQNRILSDEFHKTQEELKAVNMQANSATAALEENRIALKKAEKFYQDIKVELQTTREALESEHKARNELEKKLALLQTQFDTQEFATREATHKMEQEVSLHKSEAQTLRTQKIKLESALEREKKAVERLETRLAVLAGGGKNPAHS